VNLKLQTESAVGTGLLALSMTALDFGFAMFFMSPYEAFHKPSSLANCNAASACLGHHHCN
jgi:uncharacterized membrane-anchored protein